MIELVLASTLIISVLATYLFIRFSHKIGINDVPNHRSLHTHVKPRTGGLAIVLAIALGAFFAQDKINSELFLLVPYVLAIALLAFIDDIRSISPITRLLLQVSIAGFFAYNEFAVESLGLFGYEIHLIPVVGFIFSLLFIVWLVNLYNFMDGMDGFSAGMAIFGFSTFAILALLKGDIGFALVNLIIVAASVGFLLFNFPPSKIFMGDVGSTVIGMLVALFSLWADNREIFPILISVIIFTPFILDSTVTLFKRALRKEAIWKAHRTHYYQRLVLLGWGHKKTLLFEYGWMFVSSSVGIFLVLCDNILAQIAVIGLFVIFCSVILGAVDKMTEDT